MYIQLVLLIADYFIGKNTDSLLNQQESESSEGLEGKGQKGQKASSSSLPSFRWFQLQYLSVYLIVMLADWLQVSLSLGLRLMFKDLSFSLHCYYPISCGMLH